LLEIDKTTCVGNYTDAVARLMSVSSDFLLLADRYYYYYYHSVVVVV